MWERERGNTRITGESFPLLIHKENRNGEFLRMLPNTLWDAAHLATECALKLAHLETFKAANFSKRRS
jgi:hypothetical protein